KARYVFLPPGRRIDTRNMNRWIFPMGTRFWKEFRRDGKLIETRLLWRRDSESTQDSWTMTTYVWDDAEQEAYRTVRGVDNARGTLHSVPSEDACRVCHGRQLERPIGFSALQLSEAGTGLRLRDLVTQNALTDPPGSPDGFV